MQWTEAAYAWLQHSASGALDESIFVAMQEASPLEIEGLLEILCANDDTCHAQPRRLRVLMQALSAAQLSRVASRRGLEARNQAGTGSSQVTDAIQIAPELLGRVYEVVHAVDALAGGHILQMLAAEPNEDAVDALASALIETPPDDWRAVSVALSPMWNADSQTLELFFARIDAGFFQPSAMAILLDLANFAFRKGLLRQHPWAHRQPELTKIMENVVHRLTKLEEDPKQFGSDVSTVHRVLNDSVALTVSMCDALGLMGAHESESHLERTLELSHRRIQSEAAGALARLGNPVGRQRLLELAADPAARLRALAYAEELGFADQIDDDLRHPVAVAEATLAAWLAEPEQFSFPPSELELVDSRTQYWPGYDEPQDCYLFRYTYRLNQGYHSNIGIVGPATHAFHTDLANLPVEDIYAAFAGWHVEHEDIFEIPVPLLNAAQRRELDQLEHNLELRGVELKESQALTFMLGEIALLARAEVGGKLSWLVTDGLELLCFPVASTPTAITPEVVLAVYRGRKLLRTFNV